MLNEVEVSTNMSSFYDILSNFTRNSLQFLTEIVNKETVQFSTCTVFIIAGASLYVLYKITGNNEHKNSCSAVNKTAKLKKFQKLTETQSAVDSFNYHKILNEFHKLCSNCSNIFNSMKCVQLISTYPELINLKLFSDGVTPFHRVCFHGNEALVDLMLAKGADPDLKTAAGENALCMALYHYLYTEAKDLKCLDVLYRKGCYLNSNDEWYEIFLNLAIKNNNKNLTEWLIAHSKSSTQKYFKKASSAPL